jgi:transposase-like protein
LEALKAEEAITEPASRYEIHASQVRQWKRELAEGVGGIFGDEQSHKEKADAALIV